METRAEHFAFELERNEDGQLVVRGELREVEARRIQAEKAQKEAKKNG